MWWFFLASLAGIASNGFNITNRTALKNNGDYAAYSWWFEFVRTTFFFVVLLSRPLPSLTPSMIWSLLLLSTVELFSNYVFMKMHALTHLSISSVISRMRVIWSPLLAWLLISESLTLSAYLGIIAIFVGIVIVTSPKEMRQDKGIKVALLFSISSALLSTVQKSTSAFANTELVIVAQGFIPIFVLPLFIKNSYSRIMQSLRTKFAQVVLGGAFNITSSYLLVEALRFTEASKVVGVYQAMTLFSVFYGIVILKENEKIARKIIGSIIVIIGVLLTVM